MNKKTALAALASALVFGAVAYSAPTRNNRAGAQLTYALNGSLRWIVNVTTTGVAFSQISGFDAGAMVYLWCDGDYYVTQQTSGHADIVAAKGVPVAARVLFPVGVLRADSIYVQVAGQTGAVNCRAFQSE